MEDKKLKRRQEIKLKISDLAFGGKGISKLDDMVFFVKDAIPNQTVNAKISKIKKKRDIIKKINVVFFSDSSE